MKKNVLIILFLLLGLVLTNLKGQSIKGIHQLKGEWYSCGKRVIEVDDTTIFTKNSAICVDGDCEFAKWIITKNCKLKYGFREGCGEISIGYGLKKKYKLKFEKNSNSIRVKKPEREELYQILNLSEATLILVRIK